MYAEWSPPRPTTVHPSQLQATFPLDYIYHNLLPLPTTTSPGELLNEYYKDRHVRDWTDPTDGILGLQQQTYSKFLPYADQPIGSSGLVGKWPRPDDLEVVQVPLYGMPVASGPGVEFRNRYIEGPSRGVSVGKVNQSSESLEGADEIVLGIIRGNDLKCVIAWPGYEPEWFTIHTRGAKDGGQLNRFYLAQQITAAYCRFFKRVEEKKVLPNNLGFYNIALHQGQNARTDSLGIQLLQLYLVGFHFTIEGHWVADIDIV